MHEGDRVAERANEARAPATPGCPLDADPTTPAPRPTAALDDASAEATTNGRVVRELRPAPQPSRRGGAQAEEREERGAANLASCVI